MNNWVLEYKGWDQVLHPHREVLCTLGNGYFTTRGALEEAGSRGSNYPGTYLAGGYDRAVSEIEGNIIENEDLVNWPNWLFMTFRIRDGRWLDFNKMQIIDYTTRLRLNTGVFEREIRFRDGENRDTTIISRRIVSMHDPHLAAIEWTIIPENWSDDITVRSGIDGGVTNSGVKRYENLNGCHLNIINMGEIDHNMIFMNSQTIQSGIFMSQVMTTNAYLNNERIKPHSESIIKTGISVCQELTFRTDNVKPARIEKVMALFTSRDFAISDPFTEAKHKIQHTGTFSELLEKHSQSWKKIWELNDFETEPGDSDLLILRLNAFHLNQTISENSVGNDIGIPSRGWHGEAYRGHIFWDELFVFPYVTLHMPEVARSVLMYRYRRLSKARENARSINRRGAMYPWQSGSSGREESQLIHFNPDSGRWLADNTYLQRHINAAIPYNVWSYYEATGDIDFMVNYGAEIILSCALFWSSISQYNQEKQRFEITGVMGPDEYHGKYPGKEFPGIDNNAYTNIMAVWVLRHAIHIIETFNCDLSCGIMEKSDVSEKDTEMWRMIVKNMYVPVSSDGIILQFDGFDRLKELDISSYRQKNGNFLRLDRILESERDSVDNYRIVKQADTLMLFYLLGPDQLKNIFTQLGYTIPDDFVTRNINYYKNITSHGSTLSKVIFSWVNACSDPKSSWDSFGEALLSDVNDLQGGTTSEGIHLGAMTGTLNIMQMRYTGLHFKDNRIYLDPNLPDEIKSIKFKFFYRNHLIILFIDHEKVRIEVTRGWTGPLEFLVNGEKIIMDKNVVAEIRQEKERIPEPDTEIRMVSDDV